MHLRTRPGPLRFLAVPTAALVLGVAAAVALVGAADPAVAAQPPVGLGTATSFAVLAATTVTNTGPSVISGSVGVSPGSAITGMTGAPNGHIVPGTGVRHRADAEAAAAQDALTTAYIDARGRRPVKAVATELGAGKTFKAGIYRSDTLGITGTLTLDGGGGPNAGQGVFVFKAASTLITETASRVVLIGGANPCNVFWQVGSSVTLGTGSTFVGTAMAQASISADTGAVIEGRLLARTAAVTLDDNVITRPACSTVAGSTSSSPGGGVSSTPGGGVSTTPGGGGTSSPTGGSGVPLRRTATPRRSSTSTGPSGTSTSGQPLGLAQTGSNTGALVGGGMLAIVVGAVILFLGRRRTAGARHR